MEFNYFMSKIIYKYKSIMYLLKDQFSKIHLNYDSKYRHLILIKLML